MLASGIRETWFRLLTKLIKSGQTDSPHPPFFDLYLLTMTSIAFLSEFETLSAGPNGRISVAFSLVRRMQNNMAAKKSTADLLQQLNDRKSDKRRTAARALRKLRDPATGPALFEALQKEFQDTRTWATQCCILCAIADSGWSSPEAASYVYELALHRVLTSRHETIILKGSAVHLGAMVERYLGFATVKLAGSAQPLLQFIHETGQCKSKVVLDTVIDGALRAITQMELSITPEESAEICQYVSATNVNVHAYDSAGGCPGNLYEPLLIAASRGTLQASPHLLDRCARSEHKGLRGQVEAVRNGIKLDCFFGVIPSNPD